MKDEEKQAVRNAKVVEALYEKPLSFGNFATVVKMGTNTEICLLNYKVESVLAYMAETFGRSLEVLRSRRSCVNGRPHGHMDYYEISCSQIYMPVPYCKAFNRNHSTLAYPNVARIVRGEAAPGGKSQIRFLSGGVLPVQLSLKRLREKIDLGRRLLYADLFAAEMELKGLRRTIQRIQQQEREWL
ncbi:hypothetical protein SAMN05216582_105127 [Selenomonas ruminantium]|uniref:Uncharacterized protein n=1 Tax=Selenomonas ruminantium TaxID=971 RepID=A0A1M6SX07_SELRU|nr:hypothetical protein [Selenomonas ruminantium]SHK49262.1 hypothetical protein SAMN05216582_105127 [Selenomonas ruminantium]